MSDQVLILLVGNGSIEVKGPFSQAEAKSEAEFLRDIGHSDKRVFLVPAIEI